MDFGRVNSGRMDLDRITLAESLFYDIWIQAKCI
jgi:hypothetical protein